MNEIDDKIDYEPGTPELLSFLKALYFLFLAVPMLAIGTFVGWCAGWMVGVWFVNAFKSSGEMVESYAMLSSLTGVSIAAYFGVPRLYRAFYGW